jgi:hypothetical protein
MKSTEQILKQDVAGRVWTPRAQREAVLDEFERSGLPATQFAARVGVKYPTFASWVRKRRRKMQNSDAGSVRQAPVLASGPGWVEAMVARPWGGGLMVHLPGGARLELRDAGQVLLVAELLRSLTAQRQLK